MSQPLLLSYFTTSTPQTHNFPTARTTIKTLIFISKMAQVGSKPAIWHHFLSFIHSAGVGL